MNLDGIHGIFPSPEVLQHEGGKDSILEKKLEKGDARWKPCQVEAVQSPPRHTNNQGGGGLKRQVSILPDKHLKYRNNITMALAAPWGVTWPRPDLPT
jgi:hypothetical protein